MLGAKGFPIQRPWSLFTRKSGGSPERCLALVATYTGDLPFNPVTSIGHSSEYELRCSCGHCEYILASTELVLFLPETLHCASCFVH